MNGQPRLIYYDMRGRAEPVRLMLHHMRRKFVDHRITSKEEWEQFKPQMPFGALPAYEEAGQLMTQSHAIFRHLARGFGWLGANEAQDISLDITQEALAEVQEDLWRFSWVKNYHEKRDQYASSRLQLHLERLEGWFTRARRQADFWVGDAPTHVDFLAFCYLDELDAFFPATLNRYERLATFRRTIENLPAIAEYIHSGTRPAVFGLGIQGPKLDPRLRLPPGSMFHSPFSDPIPLT